MKTAQAKDSPYTEYAEVALPIPLRKTFTYRVPAALRDSILPGTRVLVPFGKRKLTGYAVALHSKIPEDSEIGESAIKNIIRALDTEPLITPEILKLTQWAADYYLASWGDILKASLPAGINVRAETHYAITELGRAQLLARGRSNETRDRVLGFLFECESAGPQELEKHLGKPVSSKIVRNLLDAGLIAPAETETATVRSKRQKAVRLVSSSPAPDAKPLTPKQQAVLDLLAEGEMLFTDLLAKANASGSTITTLAKRGMIEVFIREIRRDPLDGEALPAIEDLVLTGPQEAAFDAVRNSISARSFKAFLLHGVTGSGKTEVYIRAMRAALEDGLSAMMLVPEISLTPIFSRRLRAVFGSSVAILHSNLSAGERFDEWRRIRSGKARIVIGTRSAVFAPLKNVGLIIIDEEHDTSYRQNESPFYNARDVGVMRANFADATVVLGSATPAVETFYNAASGKYTYLQLAGRIAERPMAEAEVIDMREVFRHAGKDVTFSPQMLEAIEATHKKGEQSIILLNRRGFSQFVLCRSCGESLKCRNCDITMTYHRRDQKLICHYCNHRVNVPDVCPFCESEFLYFIGEGTEQVEDILRKRFPQLRIERVDRDTISKKRNLDKILLRFSRHEIDMLIGTQMLAKGHDFPNVTLVGVISVDIGLGLPDLRAAERTFQLLTQVAGRAGRGDLPGKVLIQTYYPEHYAIRHAQLQDYAGFYAEEIRYRERLGYPPFFVLASILVRHSDLEHVQKTAEILKRSFETADPGRTVRVTGPAPAPLARLKGEYRVQMIIRSQSRKRLREVLDLALENARAKKCDFRITHIEIDPINMM